VRRELLDGLEAVLPAGAFARAPFQRIALWLRADGAPAPRPALCLVEDGWLEMEVVLPERARTARNPAERRACLEAALLGALVEVARRFGLPARRLRRARHHRLVSVPLRRRR
jgi:hypothetical protein